MLTERNHDAISGIVNGLTIPQPTYPRDPIILVHSYRDELVKQLAEHFLEDNPRFDRERFKAACEMPTIASPIVSHGKLRHMLHVFAQFV